MLFFNPFAETILVVTVVSQVGWATFVAHQNVKTPFTRCLFRWRREQVAQESVRQPYYPA